MKFLSVVFGIVLSCGVLLSPGFSNAETITLDFQVSAGADDVDNRVSACSATYTMHRLGSQTESWYQAFRFQAVNIPQGATIGANTYVSVMAEDSQTSGSNALDLTIGAENIDDAAAANCTTRKPATLFSSSITTAVVDWNTSAAWTAGSWYNTPSITSVIQEIVNRPGWVSGSDINILIGDDILSGGFRDTETYEDGAASAPKLHIEYVTSASSPVSSDDHTPPVRYSGQPKGVLDEKTSETEIYLETDEASFCKYATHANIPDYLMSDIFSTDTLGGTQHYAKVSGLETGNTYKYYAKCLDVRGNVNPDDFIISFSIATPAPTPISAPAPLPTPSFFVTLTPHPASGQMPLDKIDLTAVVSGTAAGPISYYFYCNRPDSSTDVFLFNYNDEYFNITETTKTAKYVCDYPSAGTYYAKVIVRREQQLAESRAEIKITEKAEEVIPEKSDYDKALEAIQIQLIEIQQKIIDLTRQLIWAFGGQLAGAVSF